MMQNIYFFKRKKFRIFFKAFKLQRFTHRKKNLNLKKKKKKKKKNIYICLLPMYDFFKLIFFHSL